jgi:hypothetical protein
MNKIYYICWDYDIFDDAGVYIKTLSGTLGFWSRKPTDKKIESYMIKEFPGWEREIRNRGKCGKTQVVWDIVEWNQID